MFNIEINFYGIMILLSLFANIVIVLRIYKKFKFSKDEIIGALVYENIGIIVGAKILTFLKEQGEANFETLGLSSYGGIIGAIFLLMIFALQFKKSFKDILLIFMPSIPLMYSIGKIGCFLAGCCYGIEYKGIFKVAYKYSLIAPKNTYLFPVQILETICFFGIFIYIIIQHRKNNFTIKTLGISFAFSGAFKFILDYLRMSHQGIIISLNQVISIIFIILGILLFNVVKLNNNNIK